MSLEDTPRRLQQRLNEIADEVGNVHFATKSDFIGGGFEEQLVNFIERYPKVKLIIIDTLQKENRMQNRANLVVTGRDVQNITLSLAFQPDSCKWELISHSDNEITTAEDPVLMAVHRLLSSGQSKWQSTASDLLGKLKEYNPSLDIRANTLTRKLNSNADMLLAKYNILYSNKRVGTEKHIVLKLEQTDMYDKTDILDTVGYPRNTDNIVYTVQRV